MDRFENIADEIAVLYRNKTAVELKNAIASALRTAAKVGEGCVRFPDGSERIYRISARNVGEEAVEHTYKHTMRPGDLLIECGRIVKAAEAAREGKK